MPPQDQEQKKVSPMVWVFFIIALIIDLAKILMFFINLVPVVGPEISFVFSFYLSVVEVVVVFGGLWMIGLYKSEKGLFFNLMATFGVAVIGSLTIAFGKMGALVGIWRLWAPETAADWMTITLFLLGLEGNVAVLAANSATPEPLDDEE